MANATRDIRETFPLVVSEAALSASPALGRIAPLILDARVEITLPACDVDAFDTDFRLRLVSLSSDALQFSLEGLPQVETRTVSVPVYSGRDDVAAARYGEQHSWVRAEASYATAAGAGLSMPQAAGVYLHPDCLLISQERPVVYALPRAYTETADDIGAQYPSDVIDDDGGECVVRPQPGTASTAVAVTALAAGKNTAVDGDAKTGMVTVTGGAGLGQGMVDISEWSDGEEAGGSGTFTGMRTVNGLYGDVIVEGLGAVSVILENGRLIIRANGEE